MSNRIVSLPFAMALSFASTCTFAAPTPTLERVVLAGDWAGAVREAAKDQSPDGSVRYLAGHGYLALDRGNEAVCMFIGAAGISGQEVWLSWTAGLTERQPSSPIAHFLHGDALARLGAWPAARGELDRALKLRPGDPLIWNARASARAASGDWLGARSDLDAASAD